MYIIPFLIISIVALHYSNFFKVNFLKVVPLSMFTIVAIYYIAGFLNNLVIATNVLFLFTIISIIIYIYISRKQDDVDSALFDKPKFVLCKFLNVSYTDVNFIKKQIFSVGFILFLSLYLIIYFINSNTYFVFYDDYSHWGPFVRDMCIRNKFYNTMGHIAINHLSYPPFTSLFEYFFIKTTNDECSMENIVRAYRLLVFSPLLAIISNVDFDNKNSHNKFVSFFIIIITFVIFNVLFRNINLFVASITGDMFMIVCFSYLLYLILHYNFDYPDKKQIYFNIINLIFTIFALILTKQIASLFFAISFFILFLISIFEKKLTKKAFITFVFVLLSSIFIYLSWKFEVKINNVSDQFDINPNFNFSYISNLFFNNNDTSYRTQVIKNYFNFLFYNNVLGLPIAIYVLFLFIIFSIIMLTTRLYYHKRLIIMQVMIFFGFILYLFILLFLYLFNFSEYEALNFASILRYIGAYFIAIFLFLIYILIEYTIFNNNFKLFITAYLIVMCLSLFSIIHINKMYIRDYNIISKIDELINHNDIENMKNIDDDNMTLIIANGYYGSGISVQFDWCFFPKKFSNLSFDGTNTSYRHTSENLTLQEFIDYVKNYHYIYFYKTDDYFWDKYGSAFNWTKEMIPLDREQVYKVNEILK